MSWTLVTGGAKRLGAEICLQLAESGHHILVHYHQSKDEASHLVQQLRMKGFTAESISGDFSSNTSTQLFIDECLVKFPEIKYLINNVGNILFLSALNTTSTQWQDLFQTNLHAPFALMQAFLPSIKNQKGSIINLGTSGIETLRFSTWASAYMASKTSLWMLTRALAKELAPFDVRVNMVSPGILENTQDPPADPKSLPMHRMGMTSEVARVIKFLLDPQSAYITGQNIEVAGAVGL